MENSNIVIGDVQIVRQSKTGSFHKIIEISFKNCTLKGVDFCRAVKAALNEANKRLHKNVPFEGHYQYVVKHEGKEIRRFENGTFTRSDDNFIFEQLMFAVRSIIHSPLFKDELSLEMISFNLEKSIKEEMEHLRVYTLMKAHFDRSFRR